MAEFTNLDVDGILDEIETREATPDSTSNLAELAGIEEKKREHGRLERYKSDAKISASQEEALFSQLKESLLKSGCTIIVFGASGHLAKTKTYPALYELFCEGVFPDNINIIGYARSKLNPQQFHEKISLKLKGDLVPSFLDRCTYFSGKSYDDDDSYVALSKYITKIGGERKTRLCYLATPPSVFVTVCTRINTFLSVNNPDNIMRVIIEKPFGKDLPSSNVLAKDISASLREDQIYRIDHYLAKEMVQNIIAFRFSNIIFDAVWNCRFIRCVKISMKEEAGLQGRGGYYDEYGVIRDVLQNHLLQVLTLIAMEPPCSLESEDVRNEKVKVLKCIQAMDEKTSVIGQYEGYREDESIKQSKNPESNQITFVQTVLFIDNARWSKVPFICKCGKALDERNTEVRIQFKNDEQTLFPNSNFNEIVMRLQPNEAIWCKVNTKSPGFSRFDEAQQFELDITYKNRFASLKLPSAYTRLILDALKGDQSLFVRSDELREAWRIVTPFLHKLESENKDPPKYQSGGRGPKDADMMADKYGFKQSHNYKWEPKEDAE